MGVATPPEQNSGARCLNCDAALAGRYCAECGQKVQDPDPTFGELISEAWDAFVSVDGRFLSSQRLLVCRPGVLTRRYLLGHRARFVPPLRLYLVCSVAYFVVSAVDPPTRGQSGSPGSAVRRDSIAHAHRTDSLEQLRRTMRDSASRVVLVEHGFTAAAGPLDSASRATADSLRAHDQAERLSAVPAWLRHRYEQGFRRIISDQHNFSPEIGEQVPRLMFVLVPVFALLLSLAYRSRRRRYPVHLVTALHLHAFAFIALTLLALWDWLPWNHARQALSAATGLWMVAYFPLALREVYGGRLRAAVARSALLAVEYAAIGLTAFMALVLLLILAY